MTPEERKAWLAERKKGIGATDAAPIVGICPWRQAADVWLSKQPDAPEVRPSFRMKLGTLLEPALAQLYSEKTGHGLTKAEFMRHAQRPWQAATLDYIVETNPRRNLQLKTTDERNEGEWGEPGSDEVPEHYLVQVQHEMLVAGLEITDVGVLIGMKEFRIYTVPFDPEIAEMLTDTERDFWFKFVVPGIMPPVDWDRPEAAKLVQRLHTPKGGEIDLGEDALEGCQRYLLNRASIKEMEHDQENIKALFAEQMGTNQLAHLPGGIIVSRKVVSRKGYSVEPTSYVDFRIKQPKKGIIS